MARVLDFLRFPENCDVFIENLLKELAKRTGQEFYDPGEDHIWMEKAGDSEFFDWKIVVSAEFNKTLEDADLAHWTYGGEWKRYA